MVVLNDSSDYVYVLMCMVVSNAYGLVANAETCKVSIERGDIADIGACLDTYWAQKKVMAPNR